MLEFNEGTDKAIKPMKPKSPIAKLLGGMKDDKTGGKPPLKGVKSKGADAMFNYKTGGKGAKPTK